MPTIDITFFDLTKEKITLSDFKGLSIKYEDKYEKHQGANHNYFLVDSDFR